MALPKSALGGLPVKGWVKHPVGFQTNAQRAATSLDPRVTTASLAKAGRLFGYLLGYSLTIRGIEGALSRGAGPVDVATEVDLYRDAAGPSGRMTRSIRDLRELVGKRVKGGARIAHGGTFRVQGVGDAATGFILDDVIKGVHIYSTEVSFRYGRLLAEVAETRADPKNVDAAVISLARALDERIKSVLSGKIRGKRGASG